MPDMNQVLSDPLFVHTMHLAVEIAVDLTIAIAVIGTSALIIGVLGGLRLAAIRSKQTERDSDCAESDYYFGNVHRRLRPQDLQYRCECDCAERHDCNNKNCSMYRGSTNSRN